MMIYATPAPKRGLQKEYPRISNTNKQDNEFDNEVKSNEQDMINLSTEAGLCSEARSEWVWIDTRHKAERPWCHWLCWLVLSPPSPPPSPSLSPPLSPPASLCPYISVVIVSQSGSGRKEEERLRRKKKKEEDYGYSRSILPLTVAGTLYSLFFIISVSYRGNRNNNGGGDGNSSNKTNTRPRTWYLTVAMGSCLISCSSKDSQCYLHMLFVLFVFMV